MSRLQKCGEHYFNGDEMITKEQVLTETNFQEEEISNQKGRVCRIERLY